MSKKQYWSILIPVIITLLAALVGLSAVTYAWFTFDPYTKVTPMEGRISEGDPNLMISESKDGPFDTQCDLNPDILSGTLQPISTADLNRFYAALSQDREGYSISFRQVDELNEWLIYGKLYLKCLGGTCDIYFHRQGLDFGADPQVLASGRLGIRITREDETVLTHIFRLDTMGETGTAQSRDTVRTENAVIAGVSGTTPEFAPDPALPIDGFILDVTPDQSLCTLDADEIAQVEYWLYLEGCDPECYNPVQSRDAVLQLAFTSNPAEEEAKDELASDE